jgi:hypothetical protein
MTYLPDKEFYLEIAKGNVPGHSIVNKFGINQDIDSSVNYEVIWDGGGSTYKGFDATGAEQVEAFSSSADDTNTTGTGAWTLEIYGLDANYALQNETLNMAGTGVTRTVNNYIRVHRAVVRTAGTGGANAGVITVRQVTTFANVFIDMIAGYNQSMVACYTIPAGKTGYLLDWFVTLAGRTNADVEARLRERPDGEVFQVKEQVSLQGAGSSSGPRSYTLPKGPFNAKSDILIEASADTNDTVVSAGFSLLLVDD